MFASNDPNRDDRLELALESLRGAPLEAPTYEVLEQTITALAAQSTSAAAEPSPTWRRRGAIATLAIAASLLVAVLWVDRAGSKLAFGDVLDRIRQAKQFSFQAEMFWGTPPKSTGKTFLRISEPDKSRSDWDMPQGKSVLIRNGTHVMMINEAKRTVVQQEISEESWGSARKSLDELQETVEKDAKSLGKQEIDGVTAVGFEAMINDRKFVVWANATTGDPVRIESIPLGEAAGHLPRQVLSHFKFDEQFPEELFSLEVPAGYDVTDNEGWTPVEEVKRVLEAYAERHDGQFPAELREADFADGGFAAELGIPADLEARDRSQRKLARTVDNVRMVLKSYRAEIDRRYLPGAKLGDAERPIFWLAEAIVTGTFVTTIPSTRKVDTPEPPKVEDADRNFTVLYGDLHVETHKQRDLPRVPEE